MNEDAVAAVIGVSRPTLRLYFAEELDHGRARKKAEVISLLYKTARKGNVSAQKKLNELIGIAEAADYGKQPSPDEDAPAKREQPPKPTKLGKKEEAALAAQTAGEGTDWGDDLKVPTTTLN